MERGEPGKRGEREIGERGERELDKRGERGIEKTRGVRVSLVTESTSPIIQSVSTANVCQKQYS